MKVPPFFAAAVAILLSLAGAQAGERVPLRVDWGDVKDDAGGFPVFCGLSLPRGAVREAAEIHLEDAEGRTVAAEVEPMARWTPETSLKWVGLHFLAKRGVEYFAVIGPKSEQPRGIQLSETAEQIIIDTGVMTMDLPKHGLLFGKTILQGSQQPLMYEASTPNHEANLTVMDAAGTAANESRPGADGRLVIEFQGPQLVVIRRAGELRTEAGQRLGRYVVRLEFHAGSGVVKMQHSFINSENTNELQYSDLFVQLFPAQERKTPWKAAFEPAPGAAPVELKLDQWRNDSAHLLQADFFHHGQKTSRRALMVRRDGGDYAPVPGDAANLEGPAGNWVSLQTVGGRVLLVMPKLAQLFPKELEVWAGTLRAHLWTSRGGRLLDYRPATLADHWGADWLDKTYPGGTAAMRKLNANAQGTSRTHDLWIAFLPPGPAAAAAPLGRLCANPPTCVQDPQWLRKTEALGFVHPYDPEHFPGMEKFVHHFVHEYLVRQQERWGDYGFLDLGCGPHSYANYGSLPGTEPPRSAQRYSDMMYHGQTALWQAYARSGDRMYRDYTHDFHRHLADFKFAHAPGPNRTEGSRIGGGISEETPIYWAGEEDRFGGGMLNGHQGFDAEGFLLQRYLTGDRWGEETIVKSGESILARFKPEVLPEIGASSDGAQPFLTAAALYLHTGDARYRALLDKIRERMIDLRTITGWADPNYYGAWEKYNIKAAGSLADYLATGSPLSRQAFEKTARIMLWDAPPTTTSYQDEHGLFANHAWRLTGNLRYASWIEEHFDRVLYEYTDAQGNDRWITNAHGGPHGGSVHNFNFLETAFYGMDLLRATEGKRKPYLALDAGPRAHPVEIYFAKDWHEPLEFELRSAAKPDLEVTWSPHERGRPGRNADMGMVHWDAYPLYYSPDFPGLGGGYTRLEMGAETVAGEYRLTNVPLVFTHNAQKLVLAAPDGVILRENHVWPRVWYFQVPAGKSGAIYGNKPLTLQRGEKTLTTEAGTWTELKGGDHDELVALTTSGLVFVNFRGGLPPVLAEHQRSLFFVPKAVQETMAAREQPQPAPTRERYQPGIDGQALVLSPGRALNIPRGSQTAEGQYQFIHYDAGTLEFWFQPRWSTGSAIESSSRNFLYGAFWPCWIRHHAGDDQDPKSASAFGLTAAAPPKPARLALPYPMHQAINITSVRERQWHHFAVSWTTDPERGWISEMYLDGRPSLPWARFQAGLGRFLEAEPPKLYPPLPWPIAEPAGGTITLLGQAFDSAIDELRISRLARYPRGFVALPQRKFEADADTLLLMHFEGDAKAWVGEVPQPEISVTGP